MRAVEGIDAAREVPSELQRQIERDVSGDVGRAVAAIQPASQVQAFDIHRAGAVPAGDGRVQREVAFDRSAARAGQLQLRAERGDRALERSIEPRLDGDLLQAPQHARPFLERKALRRDFQIDHRRVLVAIDASADREGRSWRFHHELVEAYQPVGPRPNVPAIRLTVRFGA